MLALIQYLGPAYSAIIVICLYFGIKIYVCKKRQLIQRDVGEGICMECGSKSCWTTVFTAFLANSSDFEPVQTILPELKINVALFGVFNL